MGVATAAGARLYIGTTASNGSTDSYTEVGEVIGLGEFGRSYNEITYSPINSRGIQKFKGSYNDGSLPVTLGRDINDAGQAALRTALDVDADYNFKVVANDDVPVTTATVTITVATPGVVSWASHGFAAGTAVVFTTTGALPTGLVAGTTYYVCDDANLASGTFALSSSFANAIAGTAIATSSTQSGTHTGTSVPAGSYQLLKAKVMSYTINFGNGPDNIIGATANLGIKSGSITEQVHLP